MRSVSAFFSPRHFPSFHHTLQRALEGVTAQLACLRPREGEEESFDRACAILESLASVRSCVILSEIANQTENDSAHVPLVRMFDTLLDAIQCVKSAAVFIFVSFLLVLC